MARKLKTYQTSLGFFDLAIAAPSMKAALEAWGAQSNLFHQGIAKQSEDPEVIAATMSKPGVVLRRPVGSHGQFTEHAHLPTHLVGDKASDERNERGAKRKKRPASIDEKTARKAALAFEKAQRQRESERRKEEAARTKEGERRQRAINSAQAALDKGRRDHNRTAARIEAERAAVEKRAQAEQARWEKQEQKLQFALQRARD